MCGLTDILRDHLRRRKQTLREKKKKRDGCGTREGGKWEREWRWRLEGDRQRCCSVNSLSLTHFTHTHTLSQTDPHTKADIQHPESGYFQRIVQLIHTATRNLS